MTPLEINKKIASMRSHDGIDNDHPWNDKENRMWNWAENIADAWELFEEMPHRFGIIKNDRQSYSIWEEYQGNKTICLQYYGEWCSTAPMAICLAWLKWKTGE